MNLFSKNKLQIPDDTETRWWHNLIITVGGLSVLSVGGMAILVYQTVISHANVGTTLIWALAFSMSGTAIGFLFAIPKAGSLTASQPNTSADQIGSEQDTGNRNTIFKVNTNLEEVSDWLTKIVVGLGLIQFQNIDTHVQKLATLVAPGIGGDQFQSLAMAMIIFYLVLGFLGGYLLTRLFFSRAFQGAQDILDRTLMGAVKAISDTNISIEPYETSIQSRETQQKAQNLIRLPLKKFTSVDGLVAWSKANYSEKDFTRAVEGYQKASELAPNEIKIKLEYAASLFYAKQPQGVVQKQMDEALKLLSPNTDIKTKEALYKALTFFSLYSDPPEGFSKTIKHGEEYVQDPLNPPSGAIWVNLTAAYGQAAAYVQSHPQTTFPFGSNFVDLRSKALNGIYQACQIGSFWKFRLRILLEKDSPQKDPDDDDLEIFEEDPEFRAALGLQAQPEKENES